MTINQNEINRFLKLPSGNVCDANGKGGNVDSGIKPISYKMKLVGPVTTVKCYPGDNLTIHKAIYEAERGTILAIDANGYSAGHIGEIIVAACMKRGLIGLIIDGGCRDANDIEELGFPVFTRSLNPGGTVKESVGNINIPINFGGIIINPGDIVFGDRDGLIIIPKNIYREVLEKAEAIYKKELDVRKMVEDGKTTIEIYGFEKLLKMKDY